MILYVNFLCWVWQFGTGDGCPRKWRLPGGIGLGIEVYR